MRKLLEDQLDALTLGQNQLQATLGGVCNEVALLRTTNVTPHLQTTPGRFPEEHRCSSKDTKVSGNSGDDDLPTDRHASVNLNSQGWDNDIDSRPSFKSDIFHIKSRSI